MNGPQAKISPEELMTQQFTAMAGITITGTLAADGTH